MMCPSCIVSSRIQDEIHCDERAVRMLQPYDAGERSDPLCRFQNLVIETRRPRTQNGYDNDDAQCLPNQ